jgi:hypothetical protein
LNRLDRLANRFDVGVQRMRVLVTTSTTLALRGTTAPAVHKLWPRERGRQATDVPVARWA